MDASPILDILRQTVPQASIEALPSVDMPTIVVDRDHLIETALVLRDHASLQFSFLADVTTVDLWPAEPRFEMVYNLVCVGEHFLTAGATQPAPTRRLRLKTRLPGDDVRVMTMTTVWPAAGWLEREVFDLFGVAFEEHPDLRRVLMPDDWEGHPLRKDYAVQIRKDTSTWAPLQMTPEEFARNVRQDHEQANRQAHPVHPKPGRDEPQSE